MSVQSSVDDVDAVTKRVKVTISQERINSEFVSALGELSKTVTMKGFRPGKAPREMIEKAHGARLQYEVRERLVRDTLTELLKQHDINFIGNPKFEFGTEKEGEGMSYTAELAIYPRPDLKNYEKFEIEVPKPPLKDEEITTVIDRLRESRATLRPLAFRNTAQKGDVLECSFVVRANGKEERVNDFSAQLGNNELRAEIEEGLTGMEIGQKKTIVTEDKLPGEKEGDPERVQRTEYEVTLIKLSEKILPEADDAFAAQVDQSVKTFLELRMKVREMLEKERERQARVRAEAAILKKLVSDNQFAVPQVLVDQEIMNMMARMGMLSRKDLEQEDFSLEQFRPQFGEAATERVRAAVAVDRLAELQKIEPKPEELRSWLTDYVTENGLQPDQAKKLFSDKENVGAVLREVMRKKVLDFLMERAKITYTDKEEEQAAA